MTNAMRVQDKQSNVLISNSHNNQIVSFKGLRYWHTKQKTETESIPEQDIAKIMLACNFHNQFLTLQNQIDKHLF